MYVGSCSGRFIAFAAATGDELWSYDTAQDGPAAQFHGDAFVGADTVVVGTDGPPKGWLYAFDRASGRLRWKHAFARGVMAQVLGRGQLVYAVGGAGEVVALNLRSGAVAWRYAGADPGESSWARHDPALVGDVLLVPWADGIVLALDARSGKQRWKTSTGSPIHSSIVAADGTAWVGTFDRKLHQLQVRTGEVIASVDARGRPYGDLQLAGDCLLVLNLDAQHTIACHDPTSGAQRWRHTLAPEISTFRPLIDGDSVVAGHEGRRLFALSLRDGSERWSCGVGGVPRGLSAGGGQLYVGMLAGTVVALPAGGCRPGR